MCNNIYDHVTIGWNCEDSHDDICYSCEVVISIAFITPKGSHCDRLVKLTLSKESVGAPFSSSTRATSMWFSRTALRSGEIPSCILWHCGMIIMSHCIVHFVRVCIHHLFGHCVLHMKAAFAPYQRCHGRMLNWGQFVQSAWSQLIWEVANLKSETNRTFRNKFSSEINTLS
jgi:hypothetical protein